MKSRGILVRNVFYLAIFGNTNMRIKVTNTHSQLFHIKIQNKIETHFSKFSLNLKNQKVVILLSFSILVFQPYSALFASRF